MARGFYIIFLIFYVNFVSYFLNFFINYYFKLIFFCFHPSALDCWGLSFVIFFDAVILISWSGSHVWDVSSSWHQSSFFMSFLVEFFPQFHHSILGWSKIRLHSFYRFTFYEMILISLPGSRVWRVSPDWFSSLFFVFWISYFNIGFVYYGLITQVVGLVD